MKDWIDMYERSSAAVGESDESLLKKYVRSGSQEAFDALVSRHFDFVSGVCLRCLGDRQLAEDATQVVFILLARKAASIRSSEFLPAWLFKAARLTAKDIRKREIRRARYEAAAMRESVRTASTRSAAWHDVEGDIDNLLARLSVDERNALLLRFYHEEEFAAIAGSCGITEEAARKRVSRAIGKLRGWLQSDGIGVSAATLLAWLTVENLARLPKVSDFVPLILNPSPTAPALLISKGVLKTMSLSKLTAIATTVAATAVLVTGGVAVAKLAHAGGNRSAKRAASSRSLLPAARLFIPSGAWLQHLPDGKYIKLCGLMTSLPGQNSLSISSPDGSLSYYQRQPNETQVQSDLVWMGRDHTVDARTHTFGESPIVCVGVVGVSDAGSPKRPFAQESMEAVMDQIAPNKAHPDNIDITVDVAHGAFKPLIETSFTSGAVRKLTDGQMISISKAVRHSGQTAHDSTGKAVDTTAFTLQVPDHYVHSSCGFNMDELDGTGHVVTVHHSGYGETYVASGHRVQLLFTFWTSELDAAGVRSFRFGVRPAHAITFPDIVIKVPQLKPSTPMP